MKLTGPPETIKRAKQLRREMSLPEVLLWRHLRQRPAGLKFRRQHPAGPYELDFYCDSVCLAIEVDGEAHNRGDRPARDARRDAWLADRNVRTLRIPATDVLRDMDSVMRHIVDVARRSPSTTRFAGGPPPPVGEDLR